MVFQIIGTTGVDFLFGTDGDDLLMGLGGGDFLYGGAGNDILNPGPTGSGVVLAGGTGNDIYVITNPTSIDFIPTDVFENDGEGIDTIYTSVPTGRRLFDNVENVILLDGIRLAKINPNALAGNALNNLVQGNTFDNILFGLEGNDTLDGRAGNDDLLGGDGNDILIGGAGADHLDGGANIDTASYATSALGVNVNLTTGLGSGGDAAGDTLTLIENLIGSNAGDVLTGDGQANVLTGSLGNDMLNGGAGADRIDGGLGTDTVSYATSVLGVNVNLATGVVSGGDAAGDVLISIENVIGSAAANTLTGSAVANSLNGGGGNDNLNGGLGNDILTGGLGSDHFIFNTAPAAGNIDTITDFNFVNDVITLENTGAGLFNNLAVGFLNPLFLKANATGVATDADDRIIYNTTTGALFYDSNGNAAGGVHQFAILAGHPATIVAADFLVI
jgi:Ca2+-binding RTX toxin-like protein